MRLPNRFSVVAVLLVCGAWSAGAVAQTDFSKFPLTKAFPADAFIAVAERHNPERAFLDAYWSEVFQAFLESGIMEDAWDLIADRIPDEDLDKVEEARDRFAELLGKIELGELFAKEWIYAGRIHGNLDLGSPYEGVFVFRMTKKQAAANHEALKGIFEEIDGLVAENTEERIVVLGETEIEGVPFTTFGFTWVPQVACVGHYNDLVIVSIFNRTVLSDTLALLKGTAKKPGLLESPRFKKAFAQLPPAEDSLVFWDTANMFNKIRGMIEAAVPAVTTPSAAPTTQGDAGGEEDVAPKVICEIVKGLAIFDHMAAVEWTDGYRVFSDSVLAVDPGAKNSHLYKALKGGSPVTQYEKYVPKEATEFWCSSGLSFLELYRCIIELVEKNVPGGAEQVEMFQSMMKEQIELDIENDVLGLLDGGVIAVDMDKDFVLMAKVTDEKKAGAQVDRLMKTVNEKLGGEGGLVMSKVKVAGQEGFTQVTHPMMVMMGGWMPVVGVTDGYVILGSSSQAAAKCLKTAAGEHPNITKSKRWQKEALFPKSGPVDAISFTDESKTVEQMQAVLGGLTMGLGMVGMMGGQDLPPEIREVVTALAPMLSKLGPVVGKMDFYKSSASYCTFDGKQWYTREVQNYKTPKPAEEAEEPVKQKGAEKH